MTRPTRTARDLRRFYVPFGAVPANGRRGLKICSYAAAPGSPEPATSVNFARRTPASALATGFCVCFTTFFSVPNEAQGVTVLCERIFIRLNSFPNTLFSSKKCSGLYANPDFYRVTTTGEEFTGKFVWYILR